VRWGTLDVSDVAHLPAAFNEKVKKSILREGDVLLNLVGASIGRAAIATAEVDGGNINQAVAVIRLVSKTITNQFAMLWLNSVDGQKQIHAEKVDVARANFSLEDTRRLTLPFPSLAEQARIVAEIEKQFTRLDAGVAALRRVQANLKRYRAAVLKAACEGRLVPTEAELAKSGKRKVKFETGEELLARILKERRKNWRGRGEYREPAAAEIRNLPVVPDGWTWASLDQILSLLRNGISAKPDAESGLPILRISAVRPLSVNLAEVRFLKAKASEYLDYTLTEGDLLFTRYNGNPDFVGVCGVVPPLSSALVHPDKLIRCKVVGSGANPAFVSIMSNTGASRDYLAKRVRTTAGQAGISGGDLKGLPIPLAPIAEQTRIVAEVERRLSVVEELEAVVVANLQRAARLRQAILQKAFTGELC
jgi:type I restriction enzyme S subunit